MLVGATDGLILVMTTSSGESVQVPLASVQRKVLAPTPNPVTPELAVVLAVMVPDPPTSVHVPPPVVGTFPAKVAVVAQTV